ncbi:MAG: HTH domain-containing protein, partial [Patescibacteria group bacterium]
LLATVAEPRFHSNVHFLLTVGKPFELKAEDEMWHERWFTKAEASKAAETILAKTAEELGKIGKPVPAAELFQILKKQAREVLGSVPNPEALESYLSISKIIKQNPYGEFGLVSWPTIRPRGIRDKAYAVLAKTAKPTHFRDVAGAIAKAGWSSKKAHPQTVHNELIKDPRFVLVGRGLYALREWGYEPGTVADVISAAIKSSRRPLYRDEIVKRVLEKRFVKANTILLNLQNKRLFRKTPEGYTLV